MSKSEFVGVDGCRSGWFSVGFDGNGCYELKVFPAFSELLDYYRDAKLILVDIPIGLPMGPEKVVSATGRPERLLSPRSSSVFSAPTRQTVEQAANSPGDYINEAPCASKIEHFWERNKQTGFRNSPEDCAGR